MSWSEAVSNRPSLVARVTVAAGLAASILIAVGCPPATEPAPDAEPPADAPSADALVDRAQELGIDFVHFNGMSGEYYYAEHVGAGAGLFDYDNDGDLDAYLLQGFMLGPDKTMADAVFPFTGTPPPRDRLFRNDLIETGRLHFTDVTEAAGIEATGYGMGIAATDYDADGWIDLYITNWGPNMLLRNNRDGTFSDVTEESGTDDPRWSASAEFVDYDGDGWHDLFLTNYVNFTMANHKACFTPSGARDFCGPLSFDPYPDRLLRNLGDGTFEDVTARSQIARAYGAGLGTACADFNGDEWIDIFVANDGMPNQLWISLGDGTFRESALLSGTAFNEDGMAEASMGVDAADFDGDGDVDLFMTHLDDETNTLYLNDGTAWFEDHSLETGLGVASRAYTGFGTAWFDYDNDGWLDLIVANGAVYTMEDLARAGDPYPLSQRNRLYRNRGDGGFDDVSDRSGAVFELAEVSRGAALGDVDNDGDSDVLIANNSGPARLLINEIGNRNHWLGLRLMDPEGRFDLLHTRVEIVRRDGSSFWRRMRVAGGYCSTNDPRILVGLGGETAIDSVRVHWPDRTVEVWRSPAVDRYTTLLKDGGEAVK